MMFDSDLTVQSWVSSVNSSGISTQPCGAPVLSMMVSDVLLPTRTDCGLSVRKSSPVTEGRSKAQQGEFVHQFLRNDRIKGDSIVCGAICVISKF